MTRRISLIKPSQLWDSFIDDFWGGGSLNTVFQSSVDMDLYETDTHIVAKFQAPGFTKDNIKITVEDNILTVEGTMTEEKEDKNKKWIMKELKSESFSRSVSLPTKIKAEEAEASFKNGVMEIKLPKAEEAKPKSISIKAS